MGAARSADRTAHIGQRFLQQNFRFAQGLEGRRCLAGSGGMLQERPGSLNLHRGGRQVVTQPVVNFAGQPVALFGHGQIVELIVGGAWFISLDFCFTNSIAILLVNLGFSGLF